MWMLPSGVTINYPQDVLIGEVNYPREIFRRWSKLELSMIGIKPFREERYDAKWFRSTGSVDIELTGEVVRTHTIVPRHTDDVAKELKEHQVRDHYIAEMFRATGLADFYDAVGDSTTKKLWSDYITALKNDAKLLKDIVDAAGTYADIIGLQFQWTLAPDAGPVPNEEDII